MGTHLSLLCVLYVCVHACVCGEGYIEHSQVVRTSMCVVVSIQGCSQNFPEGGSIELHREGLGTPPEQK